MSITDSPSGTPGNPALPDPPIRVGSEAQVEIEKVALGGAGLATLSGVPLFVFGAIPGQKVKARVLRSNGSAFEGEVIEVLRRARDEVLPRCQHAHDQSGTLWQCLSYDKQLLYKDEVVRDALGTRIAGRILKIIPSPQVYHYRNTLELTFGFEGTQGRGESPTIGFYPPHEWTKVVPVTDCALYDEQLSALLADVRRWMGETRLPVWNPKTRRGTLRTLLLRRGIQTGEQMICFFVNARRKDLEPLFQHFLRFGGRPGLASLLVMEQTALHGQLAPPRVHTLVGGATIAERLFDLTFDLSPFSFFHPNTLALEKRAQAVVDGAEISLKDTVLDLYCSMGVMGQYLSRFSQKVVGVENSTEALDDALRSASKNRIANISFYRGRVEQVLHAQLRPGGKYHFDIVVLEPPRVGLSAKALEGVLAHAPRQIVYLSSNPATLARDLGEFLKSGYELRSIQPLDMFPHTPHVETVTVLQKA